MITSTERRLISTLVIEYTTRIVDCLTDRDVDGVLINQSEFSELLCQMVLAAQIDGKREILVNSNN